MSIANVNVKPVFIQLIHSRAYEGPCRVGRKEDMTPEAERRVARKQYDGFVREVQANVGPTVTLLEPTYIEWGDDFVLHDAELARLEPDVRDADLILMAPTGLPQYPAVTIAERYAKPVGMLGWIASVDIAAYLRARGMEGYAFLDYEHLNHVLSLMRARKAFRNMRMLVAVEGNPAVPTGVVSSIFDFEGLKRRYGVDYTSISATDLLEAMYALDESEIQQVNELTDTLMANADAVHMEREGIVPSVEFHVAVKKALARYECNAFVAPCFEICAKEMSADRRVTFCLNHSLLKDQGIPAACEADTNALMAIALLMYLSDRSVYMGNSYMVDGGSSSNAVASIADESVYVGNPYRVDRAQNLLGIFHDVPGLKMKGFDEPDLPYEIRSFTTAGWGATLRYDFFRDVGAPVTMARFDPTGRRVLVVRGRVAGSSGFDEVGCILSVHVKVRDISDVLSKEMDFGHHLAMVYGDYADQVRELGAMMGFEVVES